MSQETVTAGTRDAVEEPEAAEGSGPRKRRRWRPRVRARWLVAASVAALVVLGYVGWASPVTLVEHVVVQAPKGISPAAVRLASGISATDHVPAVDADRVREAIRSQFPEVADVTVDRALPHTIRLTVTVRTPLAVVQNGGATYLMDAGGVLYDKVSSTKGLPIVQSSTEAGRDEARDVLLMMPADLRGRVTTVTASTHDDVTVVLRSGAQVRWGNAADSALKAKVLAALLAVKATHYDVSTPSMPTTRGTPTS